MAAMNLDFLHSDVIKIEGVSYRIKERKSKFTGEDPQL